MDTQKVEDNETWLQDLIVAALEIGISKKEFMEDYYFDEMSLIFESYNKMHTSKADDIEEVYWDDI